MAKQKEYWYVLVMEDDGPAFVTGTGDHHMAYWNKSEKPKEFSKEWALDMMKGLTWNGFTAYPVCSPIELDHQPYNYQKWQIKWEEKEQEVVE